MSNTQGSGTDTWVKVKCDRCDGRGFHRMPLSSEFKLEVSGVAAYCQQCDGRGTLEAEMA